MFNVKNKIVRSIVDKSPILTKTFGVLILAASCFCTTQAALAQPGIFSLRENVMAKLNPTGLRDELVDGMQTAHANRQKGHYRALRAKLLALAAAGLVAFPAVSHAGESKKHSSEIPPGTIAVLNLNKYKVGDTVSWSRIVSSNDDGATVVELHGEIIRIEGDSAQVKYTTRNGQNGYYLSKLKLHMNGWYQVGGQSAKASWFGW